MFSRLVKEYTGRQGVMRRLKIENQFYGFKKRIVYRRV